MTFTGWKLVSNFLDTTAKVKKPVEAIQCANTFSLLQRKMYNVLLANSAGNLMAVATHRIAIRILCDLMGYHSNDYKTIKQKFRELRRMDIEWDVINENGNKVWTHTSPLSLARIIEGEGICEYEFTPSIIPYLNRPALYAKLSLAIQAKFKSSYGLALYENCERYRNLGHTRSFDIPTFRKLMGVGESEYNEFFSLKRRVIQVAIQEVNQYADFTIEAEYEKKGRAVVSIKFIIKNKQSECAVVPKKIDATSHEDKLSDDLKNSFGLKQKEIDTYMQKYGRDYIEEKMNAILNSDSFKKGMIKSMAGYLKTALAEDFKTSVSSKTIVDKQRHDRETLLSQKNKQEEKLNQKKTEYESYLSKEICRMVENMSADVKRPILTAFEQYLGSDCYLGIFRKEGLGNILILDRFIEFIRIHHQEILSTMISFSDYIKDPIVE